MKVRWSMEVLELTPSRKAKLILINVLEYAEAGGMRPEDCGIALEAISNCLTSVGDDPELVLSGLIDQIDMIVNAEEVRMCPGEMRLVR